MSRKHFSVAQITTAEQRLQALEVFKVVYCEEKGWVGDLETMFSPKDLETNDVEWYSVSHRDKVVGVVRVLYAIDFSLYAQYGFQLSIPGLDVEQFVRDNNIAEVGRFAVLPAYRRRFIAAAMLMKAAGNAATTRGFSHFITDVFEDDPNTPHGFHRRVLGFQEVATHDTGELNCDSRRITMLLDLKEANVRLSKRKGWFFRFLNSTPETQGTAVSA